jgi:rRNA maturation RNase YbeY
LRNWRNTVAGPPEIPEGSRGVSTDARRVQVHNRQAWRQLPGELAASLERCGEAALGLLEERYLARVKLPGLVSVSLIDDPEIQRVHTQFMDNPDPTDVITFPYGEEGDVLISVETAARQAEQLGASFEREIALYLIHGLLHLAGYDDTTPAAREEMDKLQESLLTKVLGSP